LNELSLCYNDFDDDDIKHTLQRNLKVLKVTSNIKITDLTLQNINEYKLRLNVLSICDTQVTTDGIIKFLSNMELSELDVALNIDDRKKFVQEKVVHS
jgi:hypothetical protein